MNSLAAENLPRLVDPEKAAEILGVSIGTLSVWRTTGRYSLPYVKVGTRVKYKIEDLQAFIERKTRNRTPIEGA